ncbi:MAG TPA: hypothetical protein VFS61_10655 [Anaerolineales bacterium]|nr:hypothetical protein [Anaerolineales bacterium]
MLKYFRVKQQPEQVVPDLGAISLSLLEQDGTLPFTIRQLNNLPENVKQRMYRGLIPPALLTRFGIDPIQWTNATKEQRVFLKAEENNEKVLITAQSSPSAADEFFALELSDNSLNGIELNLLVLNDPATPRYSIDQTEDGASTMFGTLKRNLKAEEQALAAGLAPAQVRAGLHGSRMVFEQIETFLSMLGHRAYFLEPLTYASAWVFERRGFAYVRGHKLMDDIHREFQPGGKLYQCLDQGAAFRKRDQAGTVRGRAWAIHDGILDALDARWDNIRMVKQIGRHAGVETFPQAVY